MSIGDLGPLSEILRRSSDPSSSRCFKDAAQQVLAQEEDAIEHQQVCYIDYIWETYVLTTLHMAMAVMWQRGPLLWLHLPASPVRVLNPYYEEVACLIQKSQIDSR